MRAKFINEARSYSRKKVVDNILQPIADELGEKLIKGKTKTGMPSAWTKVTLDYYTLGNLKIVIKETKVEGMGAEDPDVFVLDSNDEEKGKRFIGMNGYSGMEDYIKEYISDPEGALSKQENGPIQWSKEKLDQLLRDLRADRDINKFSDEQAWDMAGNILDMEEGLEAYVRRALGIQDVQGWLADRI